MEQFNWKKFNDYYQKILDSYNWEVEYNTDTSTEHPTEDDDIVRYFNEN